MDIEEIRTLTDLMIENDLSEIMIRDGDKRIILRRGTQAAPVQSITMTPAPAAVDGSGTQVPAAQEAAAPAADPNLVEITSPMVGTFYTASDPESAPFVQIGDQVDPDSVICIIEAMKVFNEIKAEVSGIIESIEIENGKPVEFGQLIMKVRTG